jgi:hypothetical protein
MGRSSERTDFCWRKLHYVGEFAVSARDFLQLVACNNH